MHPLSAMLQLHQSNRLESLVNELLTVLDTPLPDPFQPETIVVQNPGMARWLSLQIAEKKNIAANFDYPLPASFIHRVFASQLNHVEEDTLFERGVLTWRIYQMLPGLIGQYRVKKLLAYLQDANDLRKRLVLSREIASVFDQYLVYRPDLLLHWEQGQDKHWQAELWRALTRKSSHHRGTLLQQFRKLTATHGLNRKHLPERLCIFGINSLAPVYLEVMHHLAGYIPVHVFHLSPCREFWEDLVSKKELWKKQARTLRERDNSSNEFLEIGNPLLASFGATGRDFFEQLMQCDAVQNDAYEKPKRACLLASIQKEILDLTDATLRPEKQLPTSQDLSIQFHICHSVQREVQVLHDRLLDLFAARPDLLPGDILAMAPNIAHYTSAVKGTFGAVDPSLTIPFSIADQNQLTDRPVIRDFMALLNLMTGRMSGPEIFVFLQSETVARSFGFSANGLLRIHKWLQESNIRWGLDHDHQKEFVPSADGRHSWRFGLDRLLLGSIMGHDTELFDSISPCIPAGLNEKELGALAAFHERLRKTHAITEKLHTPTDWATHLERMLVDFFSSNNEDDLEEILKLRGHIQDFLQSCTAAGMDEKIDFAVILEHFTRVCDTPSPSQPFLNGRVTFCNMVPMRTIPFKVICLLGMNDDSYPRRQHPPEFDLMAASPRLGDRNRRDDDKYLFLEALLAAREVLYISWHGRDRNSNKERPASIVVAELQDYIEKRYAVAGASALQTTEHPLQPFSKRCFDGTTGRASYNIHWLPDPNACAVTSFLDTPLPEKKPLGREIELSDLVNFWNNPTRFFLHHSLGVWTDHVEENLQTEEPFVLDALEIHQLKTLHIAGMQAGEMNTQLYKRYMAKGFLPRAGFGEFYEKNLDEACSVLAVNLAPFLDSPCQDIELEVEVGNYRVLGRLQNLFKNGIVTYRPAKLKARDRFNLWILHLLLNIAQPSDCALQSHHIAQDCRFSLPPLQTACQELQTLLEYYSEGQRRPLHFFPDTSYAWAEAEPEQKLAKALAAWNGNWIYPGEKERDSAVTLVFKYTEPFDQDFAKLAGLWDTPLSLADEEPY